MVKLSEVLAARVRISLGLRERALDRAQLPVTVENVFDRGARNRGCFLRHVGDHPRGGQHDFACVGVELATKQREQ